MRLQILGITGLIAVGVVATAQDWPQWMGPNRDAKVQGFTAPSKWPSKLEQEWKQPVGDGVATPALVGNRLFVFTRQGANEVVRCLDAQTGKELWAEQYEVQGATGPAQGFAGPRCTPAVANGKVVTFGVRGHLHCYDAETGKTLWKKNDHPGSWPIFYTSASPMVVDGIVIAQVGNREDGGITAYALASGEKRWTWDNDGPAYSSPVMMTVGGKKLVIAMTEKLMVGLELTTGKLMWESPWEAGRGPGNYNATTPVIDGQTLVYGGGNRGTRGVKLEMKGDTIEGREIWKSNEKSIQFNTPILIDGHLYSISQENELVCSQLSDGKVTWSKPIGSPGEAANANAPPPGKGKGKGGRGPRGGYGSVVDAGSVLFALSPTAELIVFEPSSSHFHELARYKVADSPTYAYPVISGKRLFIKDRDNLTRWTLP